MFLYSMTGVLHYDQRSGNNLKTNNNSSSCILEYIELGLAGMILDQLACYLQDITFDDIVRLEVFEINKADSAFIASFD